MAYDAKTYPSLDSEWPMMLRLAACRALSSVKSRVFHNRFLFILLWFWYGF